MLRNENKLKERENARSKEQWRLDDETEEENKRKQLELNKKVHQDIEDFNRKEERKKKSNYEKVKDKELIESIVQKEKALDQLDKQEKEGKSRSFTKIKSTSNTSLHRIKPNRGWTNSRKKKPTGSTRKSRSSDWRKKPNELTCSKTCIKKEKKRCCIS